MIREIIIQSFSTLGRNPLRSFLTMLGIVWGIVAVTVLMAYGSGFREVVLRCFEAFGKSAVICWPGQTSEQAGGERAGKRVQFEKDDLDAIRAEATLVKHSSLETVRWRSVTYGERLANTAVRGVYPEYGEIRNELPAEGRWLNHEDFQQRRRVVFIGAKLHKQLFAGRPAIDETVVIDNLRFTVIGTMAPKLQLSNYFTSDDESAFIPYSTAGDMWNTRYASVLVFASVSPSLEPRAIQQVRDIIARRQRFTATDQRAFRTIGREQIRPIIDGITVGLKVLLIFIGTLTLSIGGVGVMNIMLVSVNERTREIGLRRALGARRSHIRLQFLLETMVLTLAGGSLGILLSFVLTKAVGSLPLLGPVFEDTSGRADLHLYITPSTILFSTGILILVGILSGLVPSIRAAKLDPIEALRYE